jgi:hypothetical protein
VSLNPHHVSGELAASAAHGQGFSGSQFKAKIETLE